MQDSSSAPEIRVCAASVSFICVLGVKVPVTPSAG